MSADLSQRSSAAPARRARRFWPRALLGILFILAAGAIAIYARYRMDLRANDQRVAAGGQLIDTACGPLEYAERGAGRPVLVLHGTGGGYDQGLLVADSLGDGFRVIAPSRFGYLQAGSPSDHSLAAQADAYACLLDALHVERAVVIGGSAGGMSAAEFALRHRDRTQALMLVSAVAQAAPPTDGGDRIPQWLFTDFGFWAATTFFPGQLMTFLGLPPAAQASMAPDEHARVVATLTTILPYGARAAGQRIDIANIDGLRAAPIELEEIAVPTLVVHATNDSLVSFAHAQDSAARVPGARLVSYEYGGHYIFVYDDVGKTLRDFMASVPAN